MENIAKSIKDDATFMDYLKIAWRQGDPKMDPSKSNVTCVCFLGLSRRWPAKELCNSDCF